MTGLGLLFAEPYARPLSTAAQFQSGCYLLFFNNATGLLATVYRDAALLWPYNETTIAGAGPQTGATRTGLKSDGTGRFDPIYLNPAITYNYQLFSAPGALLESGIAVNVSNAPRPTDIVKNGASSRSVSTTLAIDPDLQIAVPAAGIYRVEGFFSWFGNTSSGVQFQLAYSGALNPAAGNTVVLYGAVDIGSGSPQSVSQALTVNTTTAAFPNLDAQSNGLRVVGAIQVLTMGTLSLKWAQDVTSTSPLSLAAGSALLISRIG